MNDLSVIRKGRLIIMDFNFKGTKKEIFETAVGLFSEKSFGTVIMKDIARAIGKQHGGLYNHFSSKQEILDTIYDFFVLHFFDERISPDDMEPILRNGSMIDIIHTMNFEFSKEHNKLMTQIYRIVQNRSYFDERARRISKEILIDECVKYGEDVFNKAIEIGRFAPFNVRYLALLCNYNRNSTYTRWGLDPTPENYKTLLEDENLIYENAIKGIVDLKKK